MAPPRPSKPPPVNVPPHQHHEASSSSSTSTDAAVLHVASPSSAMLSEHSVLHMDAQRGQEEEREVVSTLRFVSTALIKCAVALFPHNIIIFLHLDIETRSFH